MDTKDILFSIMSKMSFREVLIFGQVNRMIHGILETEEYWSYRSSGLTKSNDLIISDPKVKYSWTIVSGFHDSKDFRDSIIYLSTRKDLLFPGLELIIGFREFVFRSVRHDNLELTKYVVSLGIPSSIIDEAGQLAVELNFKSIAEFICSVISSGKCRISFHVRYSTEPSALSKEYIIDLVKYGKYDRNIHPYNQIAYLCGLVEKYAIAQTEQEKLQTEDEFIDLLEEKKLTFFHFHYKLSGDLREIGKYLPRGSVRMINTFMKREVNKTNLLTGAICADIVPLIRCIRRTYFNCIPYGAIIHSAGMYDAIKNMMTVTPDPGLFEAVLRGGNYRLFYRMTEEYPPSKIVDLNHVCPMMLVEIIRKYGTLLIDSFRKNYHFLSPYLYNLLRGHGLSKEPGIVDIAEHVQIERYPYLLVDLSYE